VQLQQKGHSTSQQQGGESGEVVVEQLQRAHWMSKQLAERGEWGDWARLDLGPVARAGEAGGGRRHDRVPQKRQRGKQSAAQRTRQAAQDTSWEAVRERAAVLMGEQQQHWHRTHSTN
jgi:hypothetical protein